MPGQPSRTQGEPPDARRPHHRRLPRPGSRTRPRPGRGRLVAGPRRPRRRRTSPRRSPGCRPERTRAVPGDVTDARHRADLVAAAAGPRRPRPARQQRQPPRPEPAAPARPTTRRAELARVYEVDVLAPHALLREALPALRRSGGVVVNVSSDAAVEAYEGWGGYGSAKAALDHLSAVLAAEEPEPPGVRARPGRHADRHAPGGVPGRGHLRPAGARDRGGAGLPRAARPTARRAAATGRPSSCCPPAAGR